MLKINEYKAWILTHFLAFTMAIALIIDPTLWKLLTPYSGYIAVLFLILTLSLTPLKALRPQWIWVIKLNRYRRELGVASFSYALVHIICFIVKRGGLEKALSYVLHPALLPVVFLAFPLLFILAITSNQYSIKKLSFQKWKKLHKKVYVAEVSIILHMILVGDKFWAMILFLPLALLQISRRFK